MIESLQASPNCTLVAYDCTSMYTNMELNERKQAVNDVLPQVVSCPGLNNTVQNIYPKTPLSPTSGNTAHEQLLLVQRQTIPPNHRGIHGSNAVTRNMLHASPPNNGTLDLKLATQRQNNNPRPIRDDGFMIWENATEEKITNFFHTANSFHHPHSISAKKNSLSWMQQCTKGNGSQAPEYWILKPTPNQRRRIDTSTELGATQTQTFADS